MLTKYTVTALIALIINLTAFSSVTAQTQNDGDAETLRKMKTNVAKIFSDKRGKVTVKYKDGTKRKGYITEVKDDTFSISDSKTGNIVPVQYEQVKSVSRDRGFPTAAKVAIGAAAGLVAVIIIVGIGISSSVN